MVIYVTLVSIFSIVLVRPYKVLSLCMSLRIFEASVSPINLELGTPAYIP